MNYTITLSPAQNAALSYTAVSEAEWIENCVYERCRLAIDEIVKIALEKSLETSTTLPTTKDEIVMMAFEKGWVETARSSQNKIDPLS